MKKSKKLEKEISERFENHEVVELLPNSVTIGNISLLMRLNSVLKEVANEQPKKSPARQQNQRSKYGKHISINQ